MSSLQVAWAPTHICISHYAVLQFMQLPLYLSPPTAGLTYKRPGKSLQADLVECAGVAGNYTAAAPGPTPVATLT